MSFIILGIIFFILIFAIIIFLLFSGNKLSKSEASRHPEFIMPTMEEESPNIIDEIKNIKSIEDAFELADGMIDSIVAEDESIDRENAYNKHTMSADFVDDMIDIEGEPIIYRFKEATNAGKEVINGIPVYIGTLILGTYLLFPLILEALFPVNYYVDLPIIGVFGMAVIISLGFVVFEIIKRINSKNTKHHYSWAISENYFIQVLDGMVDIGFDKKDIWHVENTGTELIFSLNVRNPIITNSSNELYDHWDEDKFVMEDVIDIDDVFDVLRDWLGQTGY